MGNEAKSVHFNYEQPNKTASSSESQKNKNEKKEPDILILVDAFWIHPHKGKGMKIRFIPYQMSIELILVFKLKYNDENHNKEQAVFNLSFEIPNTWGESELKEIEIKYSEIKNNTIFSELNIKKGNDYQYYHKIIINDNNGIFW